METNKQKAIREAWGSFWTNKVNENGWLEINSKTYSNDELFDRLKFNSEKHSIRPKSLQGIETNNGWISILSESDLPSDLQICHFIPCGFFDKRFIGFIDRSSDEVYFVDESFKSKGNNEIYLNSWLPSQITHYKSINLEQPPIY